MFCTEINIGDLVCIKSWDMTDSESGWISPPADYGIVIEIIEIKDDFIIWDGQTRCYDFIVYWAVKGNSETLPDIIIEKFSDWIRRENER